jgi:hypothetical protein
MQRAERRGIRAVYTPLAPPPGMAHANRVRDSGSLRGRRIAGAAGAALLAACATSPPADPDGTAETALAIEIAPRADALDCEADSQPDCADWFRFRTAEAGTLRVSVTPAPPAASPAGGAKASPAAFELAIAQAAGTEVGRARAIGNAPAALPVESDAPTEYVAVVTLPPGSGAAAYRLTFDPVAAGGGGAQAAPAGRVSRWTILEVEPDGAVLIDGGSRDGLRAGLRGRLRDGSRTLGSVVVVDVFDEGARARIEGSLSGEIGPDTVAEIEGPPGRR